MKMFWVVVSYVALHVLYEPNALTMNIECYVNNYHDITMMIITYRLQSQRINICTARD